MLLSKIIVIGETCLNNVWCINYKQQRLVSHFFKGKTAESLGLVSHPHSDITTQLCRCSAQTSINTV